MNRSNKNLLFGSILFLGWTGSLWGASEQLHVSGNQVLTVSGGCTVRLRGVNADSLEYLPGGQGLGGSILNTVSEAVTSWKANIIRLPLSQDFWFGCTNSKVGGNPVNGPNYQALVDSIVNYCSGQNVYVLLDLHWSGSQTGATAPCGTGWGNATVQRYMPDDNSVTFWSDVSTRYANNPAVLFDLYNEPFDYGGSGWTYWRDGGTDATYGYHTPGMQALLNAVRATGANNIVVAGGLDYAYDLSGVYYNDCGGAPCALTDTPSGNGVMYSSHIYPQKGSNPWIPSNGDVVISYTASVHPVLIGEFGQGNSISGYTPSPDTNGTWDQSLIDWMNGNNAASYQYHWTAWDMHYNSCPCLLQSDWMTATSYHGVPVSMALATVQPICLPTATPTLSPTPCGYPGPLCTPSDTPTSTSTPSSQGLVFPNPWPDPTSPSDWASFNYQNDQQQDRVELKIFTTAYRKIYEDDSLPTAPGGQTGTVDLANLPISNGLYYFVVVWENSGGQTQKVMKVLVQR